jgi:hypothetical protein
MFKLNQLHRRMISIGTTLVLAIQILLGSSPSQAEIEKRLTSMSSHINVQINEDVLEQVDVLINRRKREVETILGRTYMFFPQIESTLATKGVPDEMKYIAVIESSLIPFIESRQGAKGMWQFMKGTGELYGLNVDKYIDERCDIEKSTVKAAAYLKALYRKYNDWNLVLAAYNCGDGTVDRAIKKTGLTDYWSLRKHLPKETQNYLPRFIAAMYIDRYYYDHDISPRFASDLLTKTSTVKVFDKVDFKKIGKELDLDIDYIRFLNPIWHKNVIPKADSGYYQLILPRHKMLAYVERFSAFENLITPIDEVLNPDEEMLAVTTETTPEEVAIETRKTIAILALGRKKKSGVAVRDSFKDELMRTNLKTDMTFAAPQEYELYTLKRKESIADVANRRNIPIAEILEINGIRDERDINPGSIIKLK